MHFQMLCLILLFTLVSLQSLKLTPSSYCLGNCIQCNVPNKCISQRDDSTGLQMSCTPNYEGSNCINLFGVYFLYTVPQLLTGFPQVVCTVPDAPDLQGYTSNNFTRTLSFPQALNLQSVLFKITVFVPKISTLPLPKVLSPTLNEISSSATSTPLLLATVQINSNPPQSFDLSTAYQSSLSTSCGQAYQFQLPTSSTNRILSATLTISSQMKYTLKNIETLVGCSGLVSTLSSTPCTACWGGTYPIYAQSTLTRCALCDFRCLTCTSASVCRTCEPSATIDILTGLCVYLDTLFAIAYPLPLRGIPNPLLLPDLNTTIQSVNNMIVYTMPQLTIKGYLLKFMLAWQGTTTINTTIDDLLALTVGDEEKQTFITNDTRYNFRIVSINRLNTKVSAKNITISSTSPFTVSNLVVVRGSCLSNCRQCQFDAFKTSPCTQCLPFFDLNTGCDSCAMGYAFLSTPQRDNRCVKCHVSCLTCTNPNADGCLSCFPTFTIDPLKYKIPQSCIKCLEDSIIAIATSCRSKCLTTVQPTPSLYPSCIQCFNSYSSNTCTECYQQLNLLPGPCTPSSAFYLSSTDGWTPKDSYSCTPDYPNLVGAMATGAFAATNLTFNLPYFPKHTGLTLLLTVLKVDGFIANSTLTLELASPNYAKTTTSVTVPRNGGADICGGNGKEIFVTFTENLPDHTDKGGLTVKVMSPQDGIFAYQLSIYLGSCSQCASNKFLYTLKYIPRYSSMNNQTGIDVWLRFNSDFKARNTTNNPIFNNVVFTLNNSVVPFKRFDSNLIEENEAVYFIALNDSLLNATLTSELLQANDIVSQGFVQNQQLETGVVSIIIENYFNVPEDERATMSQIELFFTILGWITLVTMIIFILIGSGVIFEQFSILVQCIALHVFINTHSLPASMKIPLSALIRVLQLNPFVDAIRNSLQNAFFSQTLSTPYFFQQYGFGVLFTRITYSIIIFNAFYVVWFVGIYFVQRCSKLALIKQITQRPVSYFDQIWRYQFLTIMFASVIQFSYFRSGSPLDTFALVVAVMAFVVALLWPIFVAVYTYVQSSKQNATYFNYLYEDIYYRKKPSVGERPKYYFHVVVRATRLFLYALLVALTVEDTTVGSIALVLLNLADLLLIAFQKIYQDNVLFIFKSVQNLGLALLSVLTIVLYSIRNTQTHQHYFDLGNGFIAVSVLLLFNAAFRVAYLAYKKCNQYRKSKKDNVYQFIDQAKEEK